MKRLLFVIVLLCGCVIAQSGPYPQQVLQLGTINLANSSGQNLTLTSSPLPLWPQGTLIWTVNNIGGGGSNCSFNLTFSGSTLGPAGPNFTSAGTTAITLSNGTVAQHIVVAPNASTPVGPFYTVGLTWVCTGFPSAGTASVEFIPDPTSFFLFQNIIANTTTVVRSIPGFLHTFTINQAGTTETITIFNNTACSGTKLATIVPSTTSPTFIFDATMSNGICILTAGTTAGDYTVTYR